MAMRRKKARFATLLFIVLALIATICVVSWVFLKPKLIFEGVTDSDGDGIPDTWEILTI